MNSSKMKDAVNLYCWIEWVLMSDLPFSFVDNDITRSNSGLDPITSKALLSGMECSVGTSRKESKLLCLLLLESFLMAGLRQVLTSLLCLPAFTTR